MGDANADVWTLCLSHGVRVDNKHKCPIDGCTQDRTFEVPRGYTTAAEITLDFGVVGAHQITPKQRLQVQMHLLGMRNET